MKHLVGLAVCAFLSAGAAGQEKPAPSFKHLDGQTLVLVANGSGASTAASDNLACVARAARAPLVVLPVPWCRYGYAIADHADHDAQLAAAARMAAWVQYLSKDCPHSSIVLLGHSSGTRVVLAAAEMLPERSLQRIYLLAPSVSCLYDLGGAARATRCGIHSFYSEFDTVLQIAADQLGTADGQRTRCAGEVGFRVPRELAGRILQVPWRDEFGGSGGHYFWVRERFLGRYVLPALLSAEPPTK